jgi:hypothetical protein
MWNDSCCNTTWNDQTHHKLTTVCTTAFHSSTLWIHIKGTFNLRTFNDLNAWNFNYSINPFCILYYFTLLSPNTYLPQVHISQSHHPLSTSFTPFWLIWVTHFNMNQHVNIDQCIGSQQAITNVPIAWRWPPWPKRVYINKYVIYHYIVACRLAAGQRPRDKYISAITK